MKTSPIEVKLINHMGTDLSVVNAARVSFDKESEFDISWAASEDFDGVFEDCIRTLKPSDTKLLKYLAAHGHTSPFNHAFLSFRVKAPIFVARQLVKHKFLPWNEISRRYVDSEPEFYFPEFYRAKADNVKQGSADTKADWTIDPKFAIDALKYYNNAIKNGVCAEQARMVLPLSTMTEWYWSGSLGAFLDMLKLRLDPHTQKESRDVAQLIAVEIKQLFPASYEARLT